MFITFFKQDAIREQIYLLMAHEMAHNWFTSSIFEIKKDEDSFCYDWFYEGVNDYFARKMLFDDGLLKR